MCLRNMKQETIEKLVLIDLLDIGLWQTLNLQKITVSIKCNKEKHNKMKYVCINIMYFSCKYLLAFILRILLEKGKKEMTEDWLVTF